MSHHHSHEHHHHENATETEALLHYMVHHNEAHLKELEDLLPILEKEGNQEAVNHLKAAIESFKKGNEDLEGALSHVQEVHE